MHPSFPSNLLRALWAYDVKSGRTQPVTRQYRSRVRTLTHTHTNEKASFHLDWFAKGKNAALKEGMQLTLRSSITTGSL